MVKKIKARTRVMKRGRIVGYLNMSLKKGSRHTFFCNKKRGPQ
jgi:hypothetical protein